MAHAFRCRTCGRLEPAEHAGENPIPAACSSCGKGVHYELGPGEVIPHWVSDPENWEVLADATPAELRAHERHYGPGFADAVERHAVTEWPAGNHRPTTIAVGLEDAIASEDHA